MTLRRHQNLLGMTGLVSKLFAIGSCLGTEHYSLSALVAENGYHHT